MRVFLAACPISDGEFRVELVEQPHECLAAGGVVSPVFGAFGDASPAVPRSGAILLLFPRSPRDLLYRAQAQLRPEELRAFFVSHGLASVGVMLEDPGAASKLFDLFGDVVSGHELWPVYDSVVRTSDVSRHPALVTGAPEEQEVSDEDLPFDAAAQVRQFNANMALIRPKIDIYAPEFYPLVEWLWGNVDRVANEIRELHPAQLASDTQVRNDATATIVELNAGLAMLTSQLLSGTHPLLRHDHPVAEYSLLGIGGMCRGLWALYSHLSRRLAEADHLGRLIRAFDIGESFPIFMNRQKLDFASWEASKVRLEVLPESKSAGVRLHVLYFSSRYGFHETLNTMSASWQCVHSSATRDWNLLTLSHEFLHAHVRELLTCVLDRFTYSELAAIVERDDPDSPWEAVAGALVSAMLHADRVRRDLPYISKQHPIHLSPGWSSAPGSTEVAAVVEGQMRRYLQEIIVHALDYLYVYDARDDLYIASIWGSWTFVPAVVKRVHHYVVRSLAALATRSAAAVPMLDAYRDAKQRLVAVFEQMTEDTGNPVVAAALALFDDEDTEARLNVEFDQAYYLARFTRSLLFDPRTAQSLQADENLILAGGTATYGVDVGTFPDFAVESPTEFLLDRFASYPSTLTDQSRSYESIWQVLLLV